MNPDGFIIVMASNPAASMGPTRSCMLAVHLKNSTVVKFAKGKISPSFMGASTIHSAVLLLAVLDWYNGVGMVYAFFGYD